jgi:hypothetical protein
MLLSIIVKARENIGKAMNAQKQFGYGAPIGFPLTTLALSFLL